MIKKSSSKILQTFFEIIKRGKVFELSKCSRDARSLIYWAVCVATLCGYYFCALNKLFGHKS